MGSDINDGTAKETENHFPNKEEKNMLRFEEKSKTAMYRVTIEGHNYSLNEVDTQKVIDLILQLTNRPCTASKLHNNPKTTTKRSVASNKTFKPAEDVKVAFKISKDGKQVKLADYVKKDTWAVIKATYEELKGTYKDQIITFTTKTAAQNFIKKCSVVTGAQRDEIRAQWNNR